MSVLVNLNRETEQELQAQADQRGMSLEDYLQEIVSKQGRIAAFRELRNDKALKLPVLHLGAMSSLHRRDIYDVR